jgi:hypothetical protein
MSMQRFAGVAVVLGLLSCGVFVTSGHGQNRGTGPKSIAPCLRSQIQCPSPTSGGNFVHINLRPDTDSVCRFDPRSIDDLRTSHGQNVHWSFCSTCPVNMDVQLDVPNGDGPFDRFLTFVPMPSADNLVLVEVPCNGYGHASGFSATGGGEWKYFMRARPTGTLQFVDEIDPRLEIDDREFAPRPDRTRWMGAALAAVVGFLLGAYLVSRRFSKTRPL